MCPLRNVVDTMIAVTSATQQCVTASRLRFADVSSAPADDGSVLPTYLPRHIMASDSFPAINSMNPAGAPAIEAVAETTTP